MDRLEGLEGVVGVSGMSQTYVSGMYHNILMVDKRIGHRISRMIHDSQ